MTGKPENESWIGDARVLLDASAQQLDAATVARLARARNEALTQRRVPPWARWRSWSLPLTGLAAACAILVAIAVWQQPRTGAGARDPAADSVAADATASDETIDLYQDLEFYAWLDAREDTDG